MPEPSYLFGGWEPIARILLVGALGYIAIVAVLKVTGARTLAQLNSFDFVITIAMGATFGRALTAQNVSLLELIAALAVLIGLQFLATSLQVRLPGTRRFLSAQPVLLYWDGEFRTRAMRRARVARADLESAVRADGNPSLDTVMAIVLESNGRLAVLPRTEGAMDLLAQFEGDGARRG